MTDMLKGRLGLILEKVPPCSLLIDVGTDHAYIPIAAVSDGKALKAVAADVNPGPLERALENIKRRGLEDRIELLLSDGLDKVSEYADCIVIAGMGGDLMSGIIERGSERICEDCTLILQPQSRIPEFRHFLHDSGFSIKDETWVEDCGKRYVVITASRGEQSFSDDIYYVYGEHGLKKHDPVLKGLILDERDKFADLISGMDPDGEGTKEAVPEALRKKLADAEKALAAYKG